MSPQQATANRQSGLPTSTGGASESQQDAEMQEINNTPQIVDREMTNPDAQAIKALLDQDADELMEPRVEPGLAGFGDSMRGALEQVLAAPSGASGEQILASLRFKSNLMKAQRKAAEAASGQTQAPRTPTAKTIRKRDASASPVESAPVPKKTKAVEFSFADTMKVTRPLKCAIAINQNGPIIGNPFDTLPGMKMTVTLDAGSLGTPSIALNFSVSKDGTHVDDNKDHYNHVTVGYEPGVMIDGKWMIQNLMWERAAVPNNEALVPITFPTAIQKLCKTQRDTDNLYFISYTVNAHRATRYDDEWLLPLAGVMEQRELANVDNTMTSMLTDQGADYVVRLWFFDHRSMINKGDQDSIMSFEKHCLKPLQLAVTHQLRPLHQYRNEDGDPVIHLDMPTIQEVGNGMYLRQGKTKHYGKKTVKGQMTYLNLPKKVTWEQIKDFHIYTGVPVVREHDFNRGLHARIEGDLHRVFLERLPIFEIDGIRIAADKALWKKSFWAGVRLTRDEDGQKDTVPPEGSIIKMNFNNDPALASYSADEDKDQLWYGRVEARPNALLKEAGVDFWVLVSMPATTNAKPKSFVKTELHPDNDLPNARISVRVNPTMAKRELKAMARFCDETFEPELLGETRLALISDPSRNTNVKYGDLTYGPKGKQSQANKDLWEAIMVEYEKTRTDNPAQMRLLRSPEKMRSNLVTCNGPPGAGKTKTLSDMIIALASIGHTVLCVAPANAAVDLDARTVYNALGDEGRKKLKCLRLESDGAEQAAILSKVNYGAYNEGDPEVNMGRAQYSDPTKPSNDPLMRNALEKIAIQYSDLEVEMDHFIEQYATIEEVYAKLQQDYKLRKSDVNVGMTLDYHIWTMTHADRQAARASYDQLRQDLGPAEFARQYAAGYISEAMFDKSAEYRACVKNYIDQNGRLPLVQREQFEAASDKMISRVLAEMNIIFTTASNAGGKLLEDSASFKPTVVICDEAGQISVPSLCVPLTSFNTWEGVFLIGDPAQLEPPFTAGQFNELLLNAKASPLAILHQKGFPGILLDTQYRMCPSISLFPNQQFYDGKLKDHPAAQQDNETRQKMRKVSKTFGIYGPGQGGANKKEKSARQGSEYLVINVKNGTSRIEKGGTSLVNFANAHAVLAVVDRMLEQKIDPGRIKILTYYNGQMRLLQKMLKEIDPELQENFTAEAKAAIEVSSVDSFQGRESDVVIVDVVAAKDPVLAKDARNAQKEKSREYQAMDMFEGEDEEDNGTDEVVKTGALTGHTRNPNRINVALTRAKDACAVICQERLLCANAGSRKGKLQNSLMNMVTNARQRSLLFDADYFEDLHPDTGALIRTIGGKEKVDELRKREDKQASHTKYGFIEQAKRASALLRKQQTATLIDVPVYRTLQGHTTRPLPVGDREAANAHDRKVEEELKKKEAQEEFKRSRDAAAMAALERGSQIEKAKAATKADLHQKEVMEKARASAKAKQAHREGKEGPEAEDDFN